MSKEEYECDVEEGNKDIHNVNTLMKCNDIFEERVKKKSKQVKKITKKSMKRMEINNDNSFEELKKTA